MIELVCLLHKLLLFNDTPVCVLLHLVALKVPRTQKALFLCVVDDESFG